MIVADEPTTALDVIVEAQILELLDRLRREEHLGLILITHNLGIVAETCDRVAVMYAGRIVEEGPVEAVFADPPTPTRRACSRRSSAWRRRSCAASTAIHPTSSTRRRAAGSGRAARTPSRRASGWTPSSIDLGGGQRAACLLHDEAVGSAAPVRP